MSNIPPELMLGVLASIAIVLLSFGCYVGARWMDDARIRNYVERTGGRVLSLKWKPFGHGWIGDSDNRIYLLRYVNAEGSERECFCKTHLFGGVYTSEDRAVSNSESIASMPVEERRLPIKWFNIE